MRNARKSYGNNYVVTLRDGHRMDVSAGTRITIFGEERAFIAYTPIAFDFFPLFPDNEITKE